MKDEENVFDDLDALRRADVKHEKHRKSKANKSAQKRRNRYVQITETGVKALDQAVGCSAILVWFEILYRVWKTGKMTVELGNKTLGGMGVSRWAKYRALTSLEKAGLIRVERHLRQSSKVTLLKRGCIVRTT